MSLSETLGNILDSKLHFNIHVDNKIKKCYKIMSLIKRLSVICFAYHLQILHMTKSGLWTYMINQKIKIFKIN